MMWFYKLKRSVRVIIAVVAWLPVFIFCGIIGGDIGENAENLQTWQAIVFLLLLAVGIVFTVFAVLARKREKQAERDAQPAAAPERQKDTPPAADVRQPSVITMSDAAIRAPAEGGIKLPMFTKAVGVTFDNCQSAIQKSNVGDAVLIKHKPTDEYENSTDIINARTGARIGRVNSDLAWSMLDAFDEGFVLDGVIADITGGDGQNYGCNIKITGEHYDD